jgi:carbon-monoxide dehydrogenase small subunit
MLVSATALLRQSPDPTEEEIRLALSGNLCRCTGYRGIVRAVRQVASGEVPPLRTAPAHADEMPPHHAG